jgi:hypothetical protein
MADNLKDARLAKICLNYLGEGGGLRTRTCLLSDAKLAELQAWLDREAADG